MINKKLKIFSCPSTKMHDPAGVAAEELLQNSDSERMRQFVRRHHRQSRKRHVLDWAGARIWCDAGAYLQGASHHQLSLREGTFEPQVPRRARPQEIPLWRREVHRLQTVRGHLPCSGLLKKCCNAEGYFLICIILRPSPSKPRSELMEAEEPLDTILIWPSASTVVSAKRPVPLMPLLR